MEMDFCGKHPILIINFKINSINMFREFSCCVGIISYRKNLFLKLDAVTGYISLIISLIMALIVYLHSFIPAAIINGIFDYWALYESFMAVFLSWGLVFLFRKYFNKTSSFISKIAETTYAAYIFHFPIVLVVQFSLDKVQIFGAVGKFAAVSIISIILTFTLCYFIRKISFVKRII